MLGKRLESRMVAIWMAHVVVLVLFFCGYTKTAAAQQFDALPPSSTASEAANSLPSASSPTIVIGFVGGMVSHDNLVHSEVQLAQKLREEYPSGVYVEAFENRRLEEAHKRILKLLDRDHDGKLSKEERDAARVILYGHSWGASAVVTLARALEQEGVPVLLTAQVDSISKMGADDGLIPGNVGRAVNFYQPDGFLHGRALIRAADPSHTQILGNYRLNYKDAPYACKGYPWFDRYLTRTHTLIECDPQVWSQVENLIRGQVGPVVAQQQSTK